MPGGRRQRGVPRSVRHALLAFLALVLALVLAGCGGSALRPGYVLEANAAVQGRDPQPGAPVVSDPAPGSPGAPLADPPVAGHESAVGATDGVRAQPGTTHHGPGVGQAASSLTAGASCAGFHDQTGITDSTVTLANIADVSGPVPGIFTSAQLATRAFAAYFNATSRICGRTLELLTLDSRTDAAGDQVAFAKACHDAFAAVGSMSAFDSGGAATAQACGLPDVRAAAVSDARNACPTCFGVQATDLHAFQNAVPDFLVQHYPAASRHAAMIYVNEAASVQNAKVQQAGEERRGMSFVYSTPFDVAEFNYSPYVQRMKEKGVRLVQFVGSGDEAVRLAGAMQQAGFKPDAFVLDPTAYDRTFVRTGGAAVDGALVFIDFTPLEEASANAELRLYMQWLQQVSPGAVPTYFGMFAWSAARLVADQLLALGGKLTRASLVGRIAAIHGWTDAGLHAPQDVGGKSNSNCWRFLQLHGGRWTAVGGSRYLCSGETRIG